MCPGRTIVILNSEMVAFACCCDETPVNSPWFEDTVLHCEEDMVAVA